jgi:putative flippase GtrA
VTRQGRFDRRWLRGAFLRFLVVGVIATGVHYLVLVAAVEIAGRSAVTGSGIGFMVGAVVNYLLNRHYTFRSTVSHRTSGARFVVVMCGAWLLNQLLMHVLTVRLGLPYLFAQVLTTGVTLFWNFAGNALWSFAHPDKAVGSP